MNSYVKIGIVGKAHGLSGLFFLSGRSSPFEHEVKYVYIEINHSYKKMKVSQILTRSSKTILGLDKILSREDLQLYKGAGVYIKKDDIHLNQEEFLWDDIVGKKVNDQTGKPFGWVERIDNFGASNIVTVENEVGFIWMIPFTEEFFDMSFKVSDPCIKTKYELNYYEAFRTN